MKKVVLFFAVCGAVALSSCGGNAADNAGTVDTTVVCNDTTATDTAAAKADTAAEVADSAAATADTAAAAPAEEAK